MIANSSSGQGRPRKIHSRSISIERPSIFFATGIRLNSLQCPKTIPFPLPFTAPSSLPKTPEICLDFYYPGFYYFSIVFQIDLALINDANFMIDRPKRTLKVRSPPILFVNAKVKKSRRAVKNIKFGKRSKRIAKSVVAGRQKAQQTQQYGPSEVGEEAQTEAVALLAAKEQRNRSEAPKQRKALWVERKRAERELERKQRLQMLGKRKDQMSFTIFNSILEYFS